MLLPHEKKTFFYHTIYSIIEGVLLGALALNEFVLVKSLGGSNYQISFLFQFQHVVLFFSLLFHEILRRTSNSKKLLLRVAFFTRLPLLLIAFFPSVIVPGDSGSIYPSLFLLVFLIYFMAAPIIFPTINLLLKSSYSHANFGKYYSYATSINKIVMMVVTFGFGYWLDFNPVAYRYVYPILGVLGFISIALLIRIPYKSTATETLRLPLYDDLVSSLKNIKHILITNKPFRDFEIGFMFYGFAWMSSAAVITIFFSKGLDLNYTSIAVYKNVYNIMAIALLPYFGSLLGKIDPRKFAIITFFSLMIYIVFLGVTSLWKSHVALGDFTLYWGLVPSYLGYGFFTATMALLWSIGSAYFCRPQESGYYQSLHLSLTGFRAIFAPLIGVWFYELYGFFWAFMIGVLSLIISIVWLLYSIHRHKNYGV